MLATIAIIALIVYALLLAFTLADGRSMIDCLLAPFGVVLVVLVGAVMAVWQVGRAIVTRLRKGC